MCALWGGMTHWSSASRLPAGARPAAPPAAARLAQVRLLAKVAAFHRVAVRDFMLSSFVVEGPSGGTLIVESLPQVWEAITTICGRDIDPLDEAFIAHMGGGADAR